MDAVASRIGVESAGKDKYRSVFYVAACEGRPFFLQKPMTYMNRSGDALLPVMQFYKLRPENLLVVHDDIDLSFGKIRFKQGGGHGGHNGLKSADAAVGANYYRLRVGIGRPPHKEYDVAGYVLENFSAEEGVRVDALCDFFSSRLGDLLSDAKRQGLLSAYAEAGGAKAT